MVKLDLDVSQVEDSGTVPAGIYTASIIAAELALSKTAGDRMLKLKIRILEGDHKGNTQWHNFNIFHSSDKARYIAMSQLKKLYAAATGKTPDVIDSTDPMMHKPFVLEYDIRESEYNGKEYKNNNIRRVFPAGEQPPQVEPQAEPQEEPANGKVESSPW